MKQKVLLEVLHMQATWLSISNHGFLLFDNQFCPIMLSKRIFFLTLWDYKITCYFNEHGYVKQEIQKDQTSIKRIISLDKSFS